MKKYSLFFDKTSYYNISFLSITLSSRQSIKISVGSIKKFDKLTQIHLQSANLIIKKKKTIRSN